MIARFLQEEKDVAQIKEDWFKIQPKLVIFGAGHVAIQLLRIAKFLDFYTIMIDDREEFADPEKLSQADEVYCRDFHDIEDILPEQDNAFMWLSHVDMQMTDYVQKRYYEDHISILE